MVDHKTHSDPAYWLTTVNGHEPWRFYNESTNEEGRFCDTCGWSGQSFKGKRRDKAEETWRLHAGDIAMGLKLEHGKHEAVNQGCYCASCQQARRARHACTELGHDWPADPASEQVCGRYLCGAQRPAEGGNPNDLTDSVAVPSVPQEDIDA